MEKTDKRIKTNRVLIIIALVFSFLSTVALTLLLIFTLSNRDKSDTADIAREKISDDPFEVVQVDANGQSYTTIAENEGIVFVEYHEDKRGNTYCVLKLLKRDSSFDDVFNSINKNIDLSYYSNVCYYERHLYVDISKGLGFEEYHFKTLDQLSKEQELTNEAKTRLLTNVGDGIEDKYQDAVNDIKQYGFKTATYISLNYSSYSTNVGTVLSTLVFETYEPRHEDYISRAFALGLDYTFVRK